MVYARRYRKRVYRRRPLTSRTVKAIVNKTVQKRSETKFKILSQTTPFALVAGTALDLDITDLGQSVTQNGRIGNQVRWSGIYTKFAVQSETTMVSQVRIIMYIPYDSDDTLGIGISPMSLIDEDRFTILYDKTMSLNAHGLQGRLCTLKNSFFKGMRKGIQSQWSSSTSTSCTRNALKIAICTNAASADKCTIMYQGRCYFKDY